MSLPETFTMADLSGKFSLNKILTDSAAADRILAGQGVGLLKRKAFNLVSPVMHLKHYKDADGVESVEIEHHLHQGDSPPPETRRMTWVEEDVDTKIFGKIKTKTRRVALTDLDDSDSFLTTGWETDCASLIQSDLYADKWTSVQVWGIEEVESGERRHTRRVKFTQTDKGGGVVHCRFVYDYLGSV
ncbi:hypothetical protein FB45DRAFT_801935 [Roridomyces roridus]|uniref:LCCL domain-containing protein n=1 Tax=Roridomyces roridus TaxID=1738132 RepID=A0AAD7BAV3_9AGAR|nr:hypothetical protein FB45DRAFT_801935 [Roridomyces roridus]